MNNNLHFISDKNHSYLFGEAARAVFTALEGSTNPSPVVALPGGRSIVPLLSALSALGIEKGPSVWSRAQFFMVDERLVPLDHEHSNFRMVNDLFFEPLLRQGLVSESQLHPFYFEPGLSDSGVGAYAKELGKFGGKLEVVILGVGEDAHVGALFPNHHSIVDEAEFFVTMDDSPKPPPGRMSASRKLIQKAELVMGLFIGEGKREALARFSDKELTLNECPAKLVGSGKMNYVVTDLL